MDNLKNNIYVLGIGCGVMSVIAFYVEQKYMKGKETVEMMDCIKLFVLVTGMVIGALMISNKKSVIKAVKDEVPKLVEQSIHTGDPNF